MKTDKPLKIDDVKLPKAEGMGEEIFGVNQRKIDLKIETRGGSGSKFAIKFYTHTASTGNYSFTGVGFKPKAVEINAYYNGGTEKYVTGYGYADGTEQHAYTSFESGGQFMNIFKSDTMCIYAFNSVQVNRKEATLVSFDNDGATFNFTQSVGTMYFIMKFYG